MYIVTGASLSELSPRPKTEFALPYYFQGSNNIHRLLFVFTSGPKRHRILSARSRTIPCPFHSVFVPVQPPAHRLPFLDALMRPRRHGVAVIVLCPHLSTSRRFRHPLGTNLPSQFSQPTSLPRWRRVRKTRLPGALGALGAVGTCISSCFPIYMCV
jgi:hypothetical protein